MINKVFRFFFPDPTPDKELVNTIKSTISELNSLCLEADRRGICVWLRVGWEKILTKGDRVVFDDAYKTETERL